VTDLFVSYKSEDRTRVQPLVEALMSDGVSLWWDAHIAGGDSWRDAIESHLAAARCVLVVWSKRSTAAEGHFVRDEATRAQRRGAYLPVRIDAVEPPLGFGEIQALSLEGWRGKRDDPRYLAVLEAVRAMIEGRGSIAGAAQPKGQFDRRYILIGGGVAAVATAGAGWALWPHAAATDTSIAVMPFANLSGDPSQSYFADGMSEELRSALTRIPQFSVIGRSSSEKLRDEDAKTVCAKLKVASVLTGSVRRSADTIRVSAQLIKGSDGFERWSETYDRASGDALAIQSAIAESVAAALRVKLLPAERATLTAGGTRNEKAHDLLLQAAALGTSDQSPEMPKRLLQMANSAITLDPNYAEAYGLKSQALTLLGTGATTLVATQDYLSEAKVAATKAISLAPGVPAGYSALARVSKSNLDLRGAKAAYDRGLELGASPPLLRSQAQFLSQIGDSAGATKALDQATALDPLVATNGVIKARLLLDSRHYEDSLVVARRQLAEHPKLTNTFLCIGASLVMLGRYKEALAEMARAPPGNAFRLAIEAVAQARLGDRAASDATLARLRSTDGDLSHMQYAGILAQQGETAQALDELDLAWRFKDPGLLTLPTDPFLDPIRGAPRFKALVAKLDFPT
jgi:TolB-like protein